MRRHVVVLMLVFVFLLAACGGGGGQDATMPDEYGGGAVEPEAQAPAPTPTLPPAPPTPTPAPTPTSAPSGTEGQAAEGGGLLSFFFPTERKAEEIRDFRVRYTQRVKVEGEGVPEEFSAQYRDGLVLMDMTMEVTTEPPASRTVVRGLYAMMGGLATGGPGQGEEGGEPVMEMIQIGNDVWFKMGENWTYFSQEESTFDPESVLADFKEYAGVEGWEQVGTETVNGFETVHYRASLSADGLGEIVQSPLADMMGLMVTEFLPSDLRFEGFTGDLYVTEDELLVKAMYATTWRGTNEEGQEVAVTSEFSYEIEGVNLGITVEPPEDMAEAEQVVPLPEGAKRTGAFGGIQSYTVSDMSLEEVMAFFEEALPANGFTITQTFTVPNGGMFQASKDGKTYMISVDAQGGQVSISIIEQ